MASSRVFSAISKRSYVAAPSLARVASAQSETLPKQEPKISKLPNGVIVASVENFSPVSRIAVVTKAGPRYESGHNIGISHCLRNCAGLSTKNHTTFGITRNIEHIGGNMVATSSREHLTYSLECLRDHVDVGVKFLSEVVTQQVFNHWEVSDFNERMKLDLAFYKENPHTVLMETLHKAAFRGGLAHSLYSPDFMIGKHSSEMLQEFVKQHFTPQNIAVVGQGIGHEELENYVENLFHLEATQEVEGGSSKYGGGEIRIEMNLPITYAAMVAEGSSFKNFKEVLSLAVLQQLLGTGSRIKYSPGAITKLGQAASKSATCPFAVASVNLNYSDSGLFGFFVAGHPEEMPSVMNGIVTQMKESTRNITEQDINTAKNKLKSALHMASEGRADGLQEMGLQALILGHLLSTCDVENAIDELTTQDINTVASRVMKGKPTIAAVGRLFNTPHLEDLI